MKETENPSCSFILGRSITYLKSPIATGQYMENSRSCQFDKISSCGLGKLVNHGGLYLWKASDSCEVYKIFKPSNDLLRRIKSKVIYSY